jgi:hypothetical protein
MDEALSRVPSLHAGEIRALSFLLKASVAHPISLRVNIVFLQRSSWQKEAEGVLPYCFCFLKNCVMAVCLGSGSALAFLPAPKFM